MRVCALALLVALDAPRLHRSILFGALTWPVPTAVALLIVVARASFVEARSRPVDPSVGMVISVAGELRSGAPLRSVLASGGLGPQVAARARSGRSFAAVPGDAFEIFGDDAALVAATVDLSVRDGGPAADMFESLGAVMLDAERTRRERRAAMAPAVLQAVVLGGIPILVLAQMAASGSLVAIVAEGGAAAMSVLVGSVATLAGVAAITAMIVRGVR